MCPENALSGQVDFKSAALQTKGTFDINDAEVDGRRSGIVRVDAEAHAQKLNVSFNEQ